MKPRKIKEGIFFAGAIDWDRRLFDALIPLPDGTSYNSFLVTGSEKTALIDTVDPSMASKLFAYFEDVKRLDYVVVNHAEQDHSGALPAVLERYKEAKVLASPKCKGMLVDHLHIPVDRICEVGDNETIPLGGKTLEFLHLPWVHWPETMATYIREDKTIFTCDLFGSHIAVSGLYENDHARVCEAAKRYYAEVMMPFRSTIKKHLERLGNYEIEVICPSHGPVHTDPSRIMGFHRDWVSEKLANTVVIPYVSMHGSTEIMVDRLTEALSSRGVNVERFNLTVTDAGKLAMALVDAATMVVASPTVLMGAHPKVISATFMANALKPKLKYLSIMGSYGWGGRMEEQVKATLANLKAEYLPSVMIKGAPVEKDFEVIDSLAEQIAEKHKESGI